MNCHPHELSVHAKASSNDEVSFYQDSAEGEETNMLGHQISLKRLMCNQSQKTVMFNGKRRGAETLRQVAILLEDFEFLTHVTAESSL